MKNFNTESKIVIAALFVAIVAIILIMFSCCSKPAERVIRSVSPAVFMFQPEYNYLIDNVAVNIDSAGNVTRFTDPYDNRWTRPNGYIYSEQIKCENLYFTDLTMKQQFDYSRIYGEQMPDDTLISHIFCNDSVIEVFYQVYDWYGGQITVEMIDFWIESGQLNQYAKKVK